MASAELRRWAVAAGLALAAHGSGAVPPPLPQTGADCERPTYASDRLVCDDAALLALDRQVREAWRAIAATQPATQPATQTASQTATPTASQTATPTAVELPPLLEAQEAWFARRSRCAFIDAQAACLQAAYRDRAQVLDGWQRAASGTLAGPGTRMRCTGAPWGGATVIVHRPTADALVLSSLSGRALAIATRGAGQDGWWPFVQIESDAPQLRLRPLSGAAITCSPG